MAKKQGVLKTKEIKVKEKIEPIDIFNNAKSKGYEGTHSLSLLLIQEWIRTKHCLYTEIYFSIFHKKWSLNNYIIDLKTLKKIERPTQVIFYDDFDEALMESLDEMLQLI